jgi:hypothetical protein
VTATNLEGEGGKKRNKEDEINQLQKICKQINGNYHQNIKLIRREKEIGQ